MNRLAAKRARRAAATQASMQEITIPLPLNGLFVEAKRAQVSGMFAAELNNLMSDGVSITSRPGLFYDPAIPNLRLRIPYEFSDTPRYIVLMNDSVQCSGFSSYTTRAFAADTMYAEISSSVIMADGGGKPLRLSSAGFAECNFTTSTAVDPATLDGVIAHHDRLIFWKTGGPLEFFVGDVGAVASGVLTQFPLDQLGSIRGRMAGMLSLTMDAGHGMNDVLAIFTTTGQVIAYEGLDPTDPDDWRLLGRVNAAAPLHKNAFTQVGSDTWMLTKSGVVSVQESLRASTLALVSDISRPILDAIAAMIAEGADDWQIFTADDGSMVVINRVLAGAAKQIIYYTKSKSWATASMGVKTFHNLGGVPQVTGLGGNELGTFVQKDAPSNISMLWVSSWFDIGRQASIAFIRPKIRAFGPVTVTVSVYSDGHDTSADQAESTQTITLTPEDTDTEVTLYERIASDAVGRSFQLRLSISAKWAAIVSVSAGIE